jgi:uncharacterized protein (TIGR02466 family)
MNKLTLLRADLITNRSVGTDQQVLELNDSINKKLNTSDQKFNNDNCYRITSFQLPDWLKEAIDKLLREIVELYQEDLVFNKVNLKNYDIHSWVNVNLPGSRNTMHSHIKAHFSCVYYIQGTETGNLRLINPANVLGNCNPSAPWMRDISYSPKDRDLIIWPAWMPHEVETNFSDKNRINITSDIIFKTNE